MMHRSKQNYSITSSARAGSVGGTLKAEGLSGRDIDPPARTWWAAGPEASAGFSPRRMRST